MLPVFLDAARFVAIRYVGNIAFVMSGFTEDGNLVPFDLGEVCNSFRVTLPWRSRGSDALTSHPVNLSIRVALRI